MGKSKSEYLWREKKGPTNFLWKVKTDNYHEKKMSKNSKIHSTQSSYLHNRFKSVKCITLRYIFGR